MQRLQRAWCYWIFTGIIFGLLLDNLNTFYLSIFFLMTKFSPFVFLQIVVESLDQLTYQIVSIYMLLLAQSDLKKKRRKRDLIWLFSYADLLLECTTIWNKENIFWRIFYQGACLHDGHYLLCCSFLVLWYSINGRIFIFDSKQKNVTKAETGYFLTEILVWNVLFSQLRLFSLWFIFSINPCFFFLIY